MGRILPAVRPWAAHGAPSPVWFPIPALRILRGTTRATAAARTTARILGASANTVAEQLRGREPPSVGGGGRSITPLGWECPRVPCEIQGPVGGAAPPRGDIPMVTLNPALPSTYRRTRRWPALTALCLSCCAATRPPSSWMKPLPSAREDVALRARLERRSGDRALAARVRAVDGNGRIAHVDVLGVEGDWAPFMEYPRPSPSSPGSCAKVLAEDPGSARAILTSHAPLGRVGSCGHRSARSVRATEVSRLTSGALLAPPAQLGIPADRFRQVLEVRTRFLDVAGDRWRGSPSRTAAAR